MARWQEDVEGFAKKVAASKPQDLQKPPGQAWPATAALDALTSVLVAAKQSDEALVAKGMDLLQRAASFVDDTSDLERLRFSLLRYSGQELRVWFDPLGSGRIP